MPEISSLKSGIQSSGSRLGHALLAAGKGLAGSILKPGIQGSRNRLGHALLAASRVLAVTVIKTLYALWLEVTGLVFALLTARGVYDLVRHYQADHFSDHKRLLIVTAFTLTCGWFTVLSYIRAKRTRK